MKASSRRDQAMQEAKAMNQKSTRGKRKILERVRLEIVDLMSVIIMFSPKIGEILSPNII